MNLLRHWAFIALALLLLAVAGLLDWLWPERHEEDEQMKP